MEIRSVRFNKTFNLSRAQLIGQGNFAKVYKLFEETLKKYLAIRRVVKADSEHEDVQKEKQINEELQRVSNPNILDIYEIIDTNDYVWYITEYCSGGSLWDALNEAKNHKFSEVETLRCILQVARGVQELHNHRITHRDLKPENILLTKKYKKGAPIPDLKVADFGLSTKNIIMETVAGTKEYIAPEQAKFHTYTNSVDVWSIGIIFDELLHGDPFYTGENNKEVFNKILKEEYKVRDEKISEPIKALLVSILKKKAYERPIIGVLKSRIEQILEEIEKKDTSPAPTLHKAFSSGVVSDPTKPALPFGPSTFQKQQAVVSPFNHQDEPSGRHNYLASNITNSTTMPADRSIEPMQSLQSSTKSVLRESKQNGIPLYQADKRKAVQHFLKKPRRPQINKSYMKLEDLYRSILRQRQQLRDQKLRMTDIQFNPNCKISPFECQANPFEKFTVLKRDFDYLNEFVADETYEIRVMQTEVSLRRAKEDVQRELRAAKSEVRGLFLEQIDQYVDELINKSLC